MRCFAYLAFVLLSSSVAYAGSTLHCRGGLAEVTVEMGPMIEGAPQLLGGTLAIAYPEGVTETRQTISDPHPHGSKVSYVFESNRYCYAGLTLSTGFHTQKQAFGSLQLLCDTGFGDMPFPADCTIE